MEHEKKIAIQKQKALKKTETSSTKRLSTHLENLAKSLRMRRETELQCSYLIQFLHTLTYEHYLFITQNQNSLSLVYL